MIRRIYRKHSWKILVALLIALVLSMPLWLRGDVYTFFSEIAATSMLEHKTTMSDIKKVGDNIYSIKHLQINNKGKLSEYPMVKLDHLYCELRPVETDVIELELVECNYGDLFILADENNHTNIVELPIDMPPRLLMNNIRVHVNTIEQREEESLIVLLDGYLQLDEKKRISDMRFRLTTIDGKPLVKVEKNPHFKPGSILPSEMLPYKLNGFSLLNIMKYDDAGKIIKYWPALQNLLEFIRN